MGWQHCQLPLGLFFYRKAVTDCVVSNREVLKNIDNALGGEAKSRPTRSRSYETMSDVDEEEEVSRVASRNRRTTKAMRLHPFQ